MRVKCLVQGHDRMTSVRHEPVSPPLVSSAKMNHLSNRASYHSISENLTTVRLSFDLALDDENDDTKAWREYFSKRLHAVLSQVILTRPFSRFVHKDCLEHTLELSAYHVVDKRS